MVVLDQRDDAVVVDVSVDVANDSGVIEVVGQGSFSWHVLSSLTDDLRTFTGTIAWAYP